jgi:hypothetical protein
MMLVWKAVFSFAGFGRQREKSRTSPAEISYVQLLDDTGTHYSTCSYSLLVRLVQILKSRHVNNNTHKGIAEVSSSTRDTHAFSCRNFLDFSPPSSKGSVGTMHHGSEVYNSVVSLLTCVIFPTRVGSFRICSADKTPDKGKDNLAS